MLTQTIEPKGLEEFVRSLQKILAQVGNVQVVTNDCYRSPWRDAKILIWGADRDAQREVDSESLKTFLGVKVEIR